MSKREEQEERLYEIAEEMFDENGEVDTTELADEACAEGLDVTYGIVRDTIDLLEEQKEVSQS